LTTKTIASLAEKVVDRTWPVGSIICEADVSIEAAMYLVRTGNVTIKMKDSGETKLVGPDGYFGDEQLLIDTTADEASTEDAPARVMPSYTVTASGTEDVTCGVLTLEACRKIMDTHSLGKKSEVKDSLVARGIPLSSLKRHTVLGSGTFGIVFLVSRVNEAGKSVAYALKVQSKYELCKNGQAHAVVYEKKIMARLRHPFLIGLVQTYQDSDFVYLLLQLVQGGELYSYIHTLTRNTLPESDARFYTACVAEGLG
jgi:Protein kinase domain